MSNKEITLNPISSALGPFMPTGTYQKNSKNITITILCNCVQEDGSENPTVASFSLTDANKIHDIMNMNGNLLVSIGEQNNDPFTKFGPFIPAGTYQDTCSNISIIIEAQCLNSKNQYEPSTLQFKQSELVGIIDIANSDGSLTLIKNYASLSNQLNDYLKANLSQYGESIQKAIVSGGMDPLTRIEFAEAVSITVFEQIKGFSSFDLTDLQVSITTNDNSVYSGNISCSGTFTEITGIVDYTPGPATPGFPTPFKLLEYSVQASGSVTINVAKGTFSIMNVSLDQGTGSLGQALFKIRDPMDMPPPIPGEPNQDGYMYSSGFSNILKNVLSEAKSNYSYTILIKLLNIIGPGIQEA